VCPGPTDTPLLTEIIGKGERADRVMQAIVRAVPMKRLGEPTDLAPAVAFLASDGAAFITGQTLSVSGGLTMA
jgi:2-hydroxycyclohexanecarboxyl-CoA dehydrogenase